MLVVVVVVVVVHGLYVVANAFLRFDHQCFTGRGDARAVQLLLSML